MEELDTIPGGDSGRTEKARLSFLTYDNFPVGDVRRPVLASWVRSRRRNLPADRIDLPYVADPISTSRWRAARTRSCCGCTSISTGSRSASS